MHALKFELWQQSMKPMSDQSKFKKYSISTPPDFSPQAAFPIDLNITV